MRGRSWTHTLMEALELLRRYDWPGNVRELASACRSLVVHTKSGQPITAGTLAVYAAASSVARTRRVEELLAARDVSLAEARLAVDRACLEKAGRECNWNISAMARRMGIDRPEDALPTLQAGGPLG